ncbi:MAG TPA: hypothetical protein VHL11_15540 [Phototrophicaceae bacterium]|jgi:WD40 repeat protein|nr:hypothetical protein [Phototrophicaceae bacterium]
MTRLTLLKILRGHHNVVETVALSSDGKRALTGSHDGTVRCWDLLTGKTLRRYNNHGSVKAPVKDVFFTKDGRRAVISEWGETRIRKFEDAVLILSLDNGDELQRFPTGGSVLSTHLSSDNRYLLTSAASQVILWEVESGKSILQLSHYSNAVVRFHPDGASFFVGSNQKITRFKVSDVERIIAEYRDFNVSHLGGMAISSDGHLLIASDSCIKIWEVETGKEYHHLYPSRKLLHIRDIAISPHNKIFGSVGDDCFLRLWSLESGVEITAETANEGLTTSIVFSDDGKTILTGNWGHSMCLWDVNDSP